MSSTLLPPDYVPCDVDDFMNPMMTEFFRQRLVEWRTELLRESGQTLLNMQNTSIQEPDIADRASLESERALELRTRDRGRKLISKIDDALRRIEAGDYGFCEDSGEPINIPSCANPEGEVDFECELAVIIGKTAFNISLCI